MNTSKDETRVLPCDSCGECSDRTSRRGFLQSAGYAGLAAALFGLSADDASAIPVTMQEGTSATGGDRRYPVPAADGVNVDRTAQLIVARFSGHMYAFALSCPHQNYVVKWVAKNQRFQCTKHDSKYQGDGVYTSGRATRNMDRYAIRRDGDSIVVNMHQWFQSDKDPAGWAAANITV